MKRSLFALLAVTSLCFFTGCCGWWFPHWGHQGYGSGYNYPSGPCSGGACGPSGTYAVPPGQSSYYSNGAVQSVQMGVPQPIEGPVTAIPSGYVAPPVVHTAAMPLESLPTY